MGGAVFSAPETASSETASPPLTIMDTIPILRRITLPPDPKNIPYIIAFAGKEGVGKSTAAEVVETYLWKCRTAFNFSDQWKRVVTRRVSFADPIRSVASVLTQIDERLFVNKIIKSAPSSIIPEITNGRLLQLIGEGLRTSVDADIWVKVLQRRISDVSSTLSQNIWVIDDVRFPNEIQAVQDAGGVVYQIRRNADKTTETGRDPNDPSETSLDTVETVFFDGILYNDLRSLEEFKEGVIYTLTQNNVLPKLD